MKKVRFYTIADKISLRNDIISFLDGENNISEVFDLPSDLETNRITLYKNLYEGIGNTPVYQVMMPNDNKLHIKTEYLNPMGNSHYSRLWIPYLFIAELLGVIVPKQSHLIEVTSGNSGIALAQACKALNYKLTLVLPDNLPNGRINPMLYFGASLIKVNGYINDCIKELRNQVVVNNLFPCNHSEEYADIQVKLMKRIAIEYRNDFGCPDYCIVGLGNGTSTIAILEDFKKFSDHTKKVIFYPNPDLNEIVLGLHHPSVNLRQIHPAKNLADEVFYTSTDAIKNVKLSFCTDTEIVNFGYSSLNAINIALQIAKNNHNKTFFTLAYDKIDRYV